MPDLSKRLSKNELTPLKRACIALGLDKDFVPQTKITHLLQKAKVYKKAFQYLRLSNEPEAKAIIEKYDSLVPAERKAMTIDHLIAATKVDHVRIVEILSGEIYRQEGLASNMLAAIESTAIMSKRIAFAKKPEGFQDAKMLLQVTGVVPVPKTMVSHVSIIGNRIDQSKTVVTAVNVPRLEDVVRDVDATLEGTSE